MKIVLLAGVLFAGLGMVPLEHRDSDEPAARPTERPTPTSADANSDANYLNLPVSRLNEILDDPKGRVSTIFHVPPEIKPAVAFWLKIYAKYSLYQTLLYDRAHPEMVYEVLDSRELFQKGLSPVALELTARNRLKRVIDGYKKAMHALEKSPRKRFAVGTPGANLVRLWGRRTSREWRQIETELRTQPGQRDRIMEGMANADPFFPAMEAIFRKFDIPTDITRLPLVESSFMLQAHSKAAAVGVWQFLESSAAGDNLVVDPDNSIDERLSPIKSTAAAAKMFRRNYKLLHDWGLAVIAYNHGPKNLVPIRERYAGKNLVKLLNKTAHSPLGFASRSYYCEFLALLHAEKYRDEIYGMAAHHHADAISIVKLRQPASIFQIAAMYNISIHDLKLFNPDIFDLNRRLPAGTRVVLPRKHGESVVLAPQVEGSFPADRTNRGIAAEEEFIEYVK